MKSTLLVHAGTHKTASSYIQGRLLGNKVKLRAGDVKLLNIDKKVGSKKILPTIIQSRDHALLRSWLGGRSGRHRSFLYSAEQCTQPLLREGRLEWFLAALEEIGFDLKLAFFLRDQPDYINSRYVQGAKKFYHSLDVSTYVDECMHKRPHVFDYDFMFSSMVSNSSVDVSFLPYGRQFGDPFERLMALPGWLPQASGEWLPSANGRVNDQPGIKGVCLALKVSAELNRQGVNLGQLKNRSSYVRRYLMPLGWPADRYFGLREDQVESIRAFYESSNDRFAQKVWSNSSWRAVFRGQKEQSLNVLDESTLSAADAREIEDLVPVVVEKLRADSPEAFR